MKQCRQILPPVILRFADLFILIALFVLVFWGGRTYLSAINTGRSTLTSIEMLYGPAVMLADGRGYYQPDLNASPELRAFLRNETDALDLNALPDVIPEGEDASVGNYHRYLLYTVAFFWRWFGVSWTHLEPLMAIMLAWCAVATYGIMRLGMGRTLGALCAIAFVFSPAMTVMISQVRDFGKAPFILTIIFLIGCMIKFRMRPRRLHGFALALGILTGVGMGFRQDVLIFMPLGLTATVIAAFRLSGGCRVCRILIPALFLLGFYSTAWPMFQRMEAGAQPYHPLVQGFSKIRMANLGLEPASYELLASGQDNYAFAMLYDYAQRTEGPLDDRFAFNSPGAEAAGRRWLLDMGVHFPADLLTRGYGAVLRTLRYADVYVPWFMLSTPILEKIHCGHRRFAEVMQYCGLAAAVVSLMLIASANLYAAFSILFFGLYVCGYTGLQCEFRHAFHLSFVPFWLAGFLADAMIRGMKGWGQASECLKNASWLRRMAARQAVFLFAALFLLFTPLLILRLYQKHTASAILNPCIQSHREPVPVVEVSAHGWTSFLLDEERSISTNEPFTNAVSDSQALCRILALLIKEMSRAEYPNFHTQSRYLVVDFDAKHMPKWMIVRHESKLRYNNLTQLIKLPAPDAGEGVQHYAFPVYELLMYDEAESSSVRNRFIGISIPQVSEEGFLGIQEITDKSVCRFLPHLTWLEGSTPRKLHQSPAFQPDPLLYYLPENDIISIMDMAQVALDFGRTEEALLLYRAGMLVLDAPEQQLSIVHALIALDPASALEAIHEVQADDERTARGKAELLLRLEKLFLDTGDEPSAADVRLALSSVNRYLEPGLRLEAAERLVASGHHAEARNRFFEVMCDHPDFIYGAERTEAFLSGIGENMEKVRFWREVTGCASEFSLPWIRLGLALEAQGATDEVEKAFSQAMQQGDGRDLAAIYLATTSSALDNPEDAAALLQNALNAHPERTPLAVQRAIAAAQGLIAEDKHEDAVTLCASLLSYTENEYSLRFDLAGAMMDAQAYSDARSVYQALLSVPDFHEKAAVRLDEALLRQEAMAARRDYWKVLFQQYADSPEIRQRYAGALFDLGEWGGCVELLESLFHAGGLSGESRVRMGIALAASGRREEGRRLFWLQDAEPEEKRLQLSILLMQSARLLAEQGQFGTAAELAEESVHINPEQEEGWVMLGTMQEKNGDAEKALQIWCAALEQLPQANRIASALHALLEQSRSPEERVEVWRQLREKYLDSSAVLIYYARALESVGRIEAALTAYQEGLAHENPPWDTMLRLGGVMIKLGRTEEGLKVVNDAVEKDESLKSLAAIVCFEAGDFLMEQDVVQSAIAAYQQSTLWNPQDLSIQMKLGNAYQRAQRFDSAAEVFEAIMAADAASSVAAQAALQWDAVLKQNKTLSQRALLWREMMQRLSAFPLPFEYGIPALVEANEMEEAIQICETMGGSLKTDAVAFICALLEFQQHPSETLWETIASGTVPFNPAPMPIISLVSIIGMRHLDAQQYDRAERLFRLAERLQPDNLWHQVRLGEALVMQQRYGDALERFRRVLRTVPESPYSADQVDRIYDMLDTPEERIREWRDLAALHPESKVLQQHLQQALQQTVHE